MIARIFAFGIVVLSFAALAAQFNVLPYAVGAQTVLQRLWIMAGYFTVLTNGLVAIHLLAVTFGWQMPASRIAGLVVSICMVAIVYHLVLAQLWNPVGLAWWADQGLHTAVPVATLVWWLAFASKDVTRQDLSKWLIWPLLYCLYAVTRGLLTGFWPYPFLDMDQLGVVRVGVNIVGLMMAFAAMGVAIFAMAFCIRRYGQPDRPS